MLDLSPKVYPLSQAARRLSGLLGPDRMDTSWKYRSRARLCDEFATRVQPRRS